MNSELFSKKVSLLLAAAILVSGYSSAADLPADKHAQWIIGRELFVRRRDGVHLSTTVVRAEGGRQEKWPAILVRAPYDDTSKLFGKWLWLDFFVKQGYAIVLQDERGRGFSE